MVFTFAFVKPICWNIGLIFFGIHEFLNCLVNKPLWIACSVESVLVFSTFKPKFGEIGFVRWRTLKMAFLF